MGEGTLDDILATVFAALGFWVGIIYSARYIRRAYIIRDKKKIVNIATLYLTALLFLWWVFWCIIFLPIPFLLIGYTIRVVIFYLLSRIYVKESVESAPTIQAETQS